jgi:hypothetical protein
VALKAADALHNVRSILADVDSEAGGKRGDVLARFNAGPLDTLWYYKAVSSIVEQRLADRGTRLAAELTSAVARLEWIVGDLGN